MWQYPSAGRLVWCLRLDNKRCMIICNMRRRRTLQIGWLQFHGDCYAWIIDRGSLFDIIETRIGDLRRRGIQDKPMAFHKWDETCDKDKCTWVIGGPKPFVGGKRGTNFLGSESIRLADCIPVGNTVPAASRGNSTCRLLFNHRSVVWLLWAWRSVIYIPHTLAPIIYIWRLAVTYPLASCRRQVDLFAIVVK